MSGGKLVLAAVLLLIAGCAGKTQAPHTAPAPAMPHFSNGILSFDYPQALTVNDTSFARNGFLMLQQGTSYYGLQIVPEYRYGNVTLLRENLIRQVQVLRDVSIAREAGGFSDTFLFQNVTYRQEYTLQERQRYYLITSLTAPAESFPEDSATFNGIIATLNISDRLNVSFAELPLENPENLSTADRMASLEQLFSIFSRYYHPGDKLVIRGDRYFTVFTYETNTTVMDLNDKVMNSTDALAHVDADVPSPRPLTAMAVVK